MYGDLIRLLRKKAESGKMRARQLANSLWALAKLSHEDEEDILALLEKMDEVRQHELIGSA
jgi:hypothetical protein